MSNFVESFKQGQEGKNVGLDTGIPALNRAMLGIHRKMLYGVVAAEKVGKTKFVDFSFVLSPYLQLQKKGLLDNIEWIYRSYEVDRVSKEFQFAAFFMAHDYNIYDFEYNGTVYGMDDNYLQGKLIDKKTDKFIPILPKHEEILKEIYINRIVPLFGEYDSDNRQISRGKIILLDHQDNPTGLYKFVKDHASRNGTWITDKYTSSGETKTKIIGYKPHNPDKYVIDITDHNRKLIKERNFNNKQNIDKWVEYQVELRNLLKYTFVGIQHSNRQLSNVERLKYAGEFIFPTSDDVKDTGNLGEEANILLTLMNPNDEKYNLDKHFGVELKDYPNYRSIHIASARNVECPQHIQCNMLGGVNMFTPLTYF